MLQKANSKSLTWKTVCFRVFKKWVDPFLFALEITILLPGLWHLLPTVGVQNTDFFFKESKDCSSAYWPRARVPSLEPSYRRCTLMQEIYWSLQLKEKALLLTCCCLTWSCQFDRAHSKLFMHPPLRNNGSQFINCLSACLKALRPFVSPLLINFWRSSSTCLNGQCGKAKRHHTREFPLFSLSQSDCI